MTEERPEASTNAIQQRFYVVSPTKFVTLFVGTLGVYSIYWFYKHWDLYRLRSGGTQWPVMRGLFPIFFAHALFSIFSREYNEKFNTTRYNFTHYATIFVGVSVCSYFFNQLSVNEIGRPFSDLFSFVALPIITWVLYHMQLVVNGICGDLQGDSNNQFSFLNYSCLLLGGLGWVIVVFGLIESFQA
ncbi:hypothetical protein GCM10007916_24840 [Psychromonas marina]|uniref:DUF4234 domain-containing protein n=1 Tax=Psychromonas marina TaxID=88364 RepID=A0ABQ6E2J1_9GAMM|nr:hypothetical protein [Psychromonas marina]GLS91415.1 hypothetical protein GCM10007916_24840 [Psychromonas marina]